MTRNHSNGATTLAGGNSQCGVVHDGRSESRTAPTDSNQSTNRTTMVTIDAR
ncbi:hypothetical protein [Halohasta litorea]|uniref:Uncharacterized protein n=1 Tax=Halohasta litorea TaxID=869891 RepID=A0ABD6DA67_9EURY|nr:hypothetical protein [Halohasta litorea]